MPIVYNLHNPPADLDHSSTLYIGRGSFWGNPYRIGQDGMDRRSVVAAYRTRLWNSFKLKGPAYERIMAGELDGLYLGCYCKPYLCHGDVLAQASYFALTGITIGSDPQLSNDARLANYNANEENAS